MLAHNLVGKYDQLVVYAFRLLNKIEQNYTIINKEALTMVYVCINSKKICWETNLFLNVEHMVLVYLVNKLHVFGRITRWLLLFLEYEFIIVYKLDRTHVVFDVLSRLPNSSEPLGIPYQTINASLFS